MIDRSQAAKTSGKLRTGKGPLVWPDDKQIMVAHMYRCPKPDAVDRWPESRAHERFKDWERENDFQSSAATMVDGCGDFV